MENQNAIKLSEKITAEAVVESNLLYEASARYGNWHSKSCASLLKEVGIDLDKKYHVFNKSGKKHLFDIQGLKPSMLLLKDKTLLNISAYKIGKDGGLGLAVVINVLNGEGDYGEYKLKEITDEKNGGDEGTTPEFDFEGTN